MLRKEGSTNILAVLALALAVGLTVTVIGTAITASMIQGQTIGEDATDFAAMIIMLVGAAMTAVVSAGMIPKMRFVMCAAGGGIYLLGLASCAAIVFDGVKTNILPSIAVIIGGSLAVYLLGIRRGHKPKYKVPKMHL